ncbi:related to serine/threonine-protein kinase [Cephalotrichum gorgonifer]|uniref:non-specific serine/threonine protein kinase n=1 Tax=Cephalotrichum gorgonifer TaxID=2041049 RepID=A0AAE8STF7_9PEZI|nr:related to serine/threonine-protein kinase [Cephalotrichum gorgonifer]
MSDREHGLGLSGLHRIRQPTIRLPNHPSNASSRSPSVGPSRSTSLSLALTPVSTTSRPSAPQSPVFTEDLSKFPSESLHSFSYAHLSEEYLHNRHSVVKRSLEYMKDHMGWASSSAAGMASAQARSLGDVEAQTMLELLAKAQLVGAGNLPHANMSGLVGPLTGPADVSGGNVFEKQFVIGQDAFVSHSPPALTPLEETPPGLHEAPAGKEDDARMEQDSIAMPPAPRTSTVSLGEATGEEPSSSRTAALLSPKPGPLKRTFTDTLPVTLQEKLIDTLAQPFLVGQPGEPVLSPLAAHSVSAAGFPSALGSVVHGHSSRWVPATQAIFTTESRPPWTILAANDLACLVFGVTKAEVRKMGILEVVQKERRAWLENKLLAGGAEVSDALPRSKPTPTPAASAATALLGGRTGITAQLLSKPNSRSQPQKKGPRRSRTVNGGSGAAGGPRHANNQSRGVLICGDVIPIQKRNGTTGSASLWVKEKRAGLIWVLEEIHEDVALLTLGDEGVVQEASGACESIWGVDRVAPGVDIGTLIPRIPRQGIDPRTGEVDFAQASKRRYFACPHSKDVNIPCTVEQIRGQLQLRVSSFPHIAGIIVISPKDLTIKSSNSAFCGALFGYEKPDGKSINMLIPAFDETLKMLTDEDGIELVDGTVVPEHSFRKASAFVAIREGRIDAATAFLRPEGVTARHRDGSELKIDLQMRVVMSERQHESIPEDSSGEEEGNGSEVESECVYALWVTYSRHLHSNKDNPSISEASTPLRQPTPGQLAPRLEDAAASLEPGRAGSPAPAVSTLAQQLKEAAWSAAAKLTGNTRPPALKTERPAVISRVAEPPLKKTIDDFQILEEMGQGAYGQVKLARYKSTGTKVVLKYVTKRRILVDTWTRDRRLGTVPLEIHVLEYLRRPELRHPNIVEMEAFFEDDTNYYIEMVPHGLPGMDLFDYIELRTTMEEVECRSIFVQVVRAVHHLHTSALVVHRDIKDENVILDGEGHIKLIDFGSAAYIKSGPFQVFVGTIDYAAPEVLAGKPYKGKEQDVWALGILLYTIIYKENPFYSIDEIMDRDLRVPFVMSEESIDLVRCMLERNVEERYTIEQVLNHPWLAGED